MLKRNILLILILLLAIVPRFILLDKVPNAINEDELHYVLDAKSFFLTGKDVLSQVSPIDVLLFNFPRSEPLQAELQYFFQIPMTGFFGFSLFNIAFPNAVFSVLTVLLIFLITRKLFDINAAYFAGFIAAISPWLIFVGRTTYESGTATIFYLCVLYVLLTAKGRKILLTIPFALLAFYSYIGTKLIFVPFMLITTIYSYFYISHKKYFKFYVCVLGFSVILTIFFIFQFKHFEVSRSAEVLLPNNPEIIRQVNEFRKVAIQNPFLSIFDNKLSIYSTVLIKNLFNIFSPSYLFVNADYFFMFGGHGLFYVIDIIFLIIGTSFVFIKKRKLFILFVGIIFLGTIPQVLHDPNGAGNFTPHIALIIPIFIILVGVGISWVYKKISNKNYSKIFIFAILFGYLMLFANFSYFYFYKFPLQAGTFPIKYRLLSKYISIVKGSTPVIVYAVNSKLAFREYVFYTNAYKANNADKINNSYKTLNLDNVMFNSCTEDYPKGKLIISDYNCGKHPSEGALSIANLIDSGPSFNIYNDTVCGKYNLGRFISNVKLSDFNIENTPEKKFCETFIVSY